MVMRFGVGVEINAVGVDHDLAQQSGFGKLVQRVVNRGQRYASLGFARGGKDLLRRPVFMRPVKQQRAQRQPLLRRPQASGLEEGGDIVSMFAHDVYYNDSKVERPEVLLRKAVRRFYIDICNNKMY